MYSSLQRSTGENSTHACGKTFALVANRASMHVYQFNGDRGVHLPLCHTPISHVRCWKCASALVLHTAFKRSRLVHHLPARRFEKK